MGILNLSVEPLPSHDTHGFRLRSHKAKHATSAMEDILETKEALTQLSNLEQKAFCCKER